MELEEFKQIAIQHGAGTQYKLDNLGTCFYVEWCIGGMHGNSCWGREDIPVEPESPADGIPELDKFLSVVVPSLTFMQYKQMNTVIERDTTSNGTDYYGNYRDYAYIGVSVETLYTKLVELNVPMVAPMLSNDTSSYGM